MEKRLPRTIRFKDDKFNRDELEYLERVDIDINKAIIKTIKKAVRKHNNEVMLETYDRPKPETRTNEVGYKEFLEGHILKTENYYDRVPLRDLYDLYLIYCKKNKARVRGKHVFRKGVEEQGFPFNASNGNIRVFRYMKLKTEEDEEWEL